MEKKTLFVVLMIVFTLLLFGIVSASAETDGIYTYSVSNGEAKITSCDTSVSGEILIPDALGGYPVTSIGSSAFKGCTGLINVTIPDSVTRIDGGAFRGCNSLVEMTLPKATYGTKEGSRFGFIFGSTTSTSSVPPSGTIYQNYKSGSYYYYHYIPTSLKKVIIRNGVIENSAFYNCKNIEEIILIDEVTSIGRSAFSDCTGLTSIAIPDSVTSIGSSAFSDCTGLTSIAIPDSVTSIEDSVFRDCKGLTNVTIPDNVTIIGDEVFRDCTYLSSVTIGNDVTSIGDKVFFGCDNLTSITIPNNLTSIGTQAFYECYRLTSIYYNGTEAQWRNNLSYWNSNFPYAERHYFAYVTFIDENGNKIKKTMQDIGETVDISSITVPEDYILTLYTDSEMTRQYDLSEEISENLVLYVKLRKVADTETVCLTSVKGEKIFIVTPKNLPNNSQIILACYSGNKLADIQSMTNINEIVYFVVSAPFDSAKVMVWEGLENMTSVCEAEIVK